jgi:ribosome-associated translation inhibitor RaiA
MSSLDFYVDFNIEVQNIRDEFNLEAEQALRELAAGHSDLIGASVALENIVKTESPYLYQVRITLYKRPEDIAVVEKGVEPMVALKGALDAIEKKVRASREKLDQMQERRAGMNDAVSQELTAEEVYATYVKDQEPEKFLRKDRTEIASKLMMEEGLKQEAAYFAADQILRVAQENANTQSKK